MGAGWLAVAGVLLWHAASRLPAQTLTQRQPVFRSGVQTVYVNVIVRDGQGAFVRDLKREDFTILEDGRPQTITTFDFEEVPSAPAEPLTAQPTESPEPLEAILKALPGAARRGAPAADARPAGSVDLRDRRLIVLLFDLSSLQPEELERAVDSAREYVERRITPADLVAVASVSSSLSVDVDFTSDREQLLLALARYLGADTTGFQEGAVPDPDEEPDETAGFAADETEFNIFNTDRRLRAIETLADAMAPIQQKKSIVYFSAGMSQTGQENQVQLRSAIDRAVKANVSVYPVDARGLTAVVPGGDASRASGRGTAMFSGRSLGQQFARQAASQDTLVALAADTGGRAFLDTNDFSLVYTRVINDTSAYYLLGYTSTNPARDGRFRRIRVQVNRPGLRVEHRNGYYAEKDFAHSSREDREWQLQDQLLSDLSSTDVTVWLSTAYFRLDNDRFYIPVSIAVPGSAIPSPPGADKANATFDIIGLMRDAERRPVGRLRDTVKLSAQQSEDARRKSLQYGTSFVLPPGTYTLKVVLRENLTGRFGSFETDVIVPDLRRAPVKLSSVVLGTQVQKASSRDAKSPLARDGMLLVPSLTHVVSRNQPVYFLYEVYEPALAESRHPRLLTSLAFFRGRVKTYETPLVEVETLNAPDRKAAVFQFAVPAAALKPGLYTCQVTVVDDVAASFAFPRLPLLVR